MVKWRWCGGLVDGGDCGGDGEGLACEGLAAATAATCFAIVKVLPLSQLDLQATHPGDCSTTRGGEDACPGSKGRELARRGGMTRRRLHQGKQDRARHSEVRWA